MRRFEPFKNEYESVYPHSMDDMSIFDIDILLRQPTMLVLAPRGDDLEKLIRRILSSAKREVPKESKVYLSQVVTDLFIDFWNEPGFYNGENTIQRVYQISEERIDRARDMNLPDKVFLGSPIYLLLDCFTVLSRKEHEDTFGKLTKIMTSARQTNIHTIVFENPQYFQSTQTGFFSAFCVLYGGYSKKYSKIFPGICKELTPGKAYILPHSEEDYIFDI